MKDEVLIYGAYGYTGKLIVELAVEKGWKPTIAGRNKELIEQLGQKFQLPTLCFAHNNQDAWDNALQNKKLLINCAGPFSLTIKPILSACLRNKVSYTDITGEMDVFEHILSQDQLAKDANIVMMPGTGFDVVPTDCLAKYLHEQLPSATHLELAFHSSSGMSRGTALSVLNRFHLGGAYRKKGHIVLDDFGSEHKMISYGGKVRYSVRIAWGDVFTAFVTTGIPNIQVFTSMPQKTHRTISKVWKLKWLIRMPIFQKIGRYIIRKKVVGPDEIQRNSFETLLWGQVSDDSGRTVQVEMRTPESYKLTAITALMCAEGILDGKVLPGFRSPASAFGSDFIMQVNGVSRELIATTK